MAQIEPRKLCNVCLEDGVKTEVCDVRACIHCKGGTCPEHLYIVRLIGGGFVYECQTCADNTAAIHSKEDHVHFAKFARFECSKCLKEPLDQDAYDDLCKECRKLKCRHCVMHDLEQSFDVAKCDNCGKLACPDHRTEYRYRTDVNGEIMGVQYACCH